VITPEAMKILENEWVQELDEYDEDGFGYALKEGAPEEFRKEFEDFVRLFKEFG